jgi:plasmid maintenance system antidote protein VapI
MNIRDIRRLRLKWHVDQEESIVAFARKYGVNETYISQLLGGHRPIGEKSARNLEAAMGLEPYTLDAIEIEMLTKDQQEWLSLFEQLTEAQKGLIRKLAEQLGALIPANQPKKGDEPEK